MEGIVTIAGRSPLSSRLMFFASSVEFLKHSMCERITPWLRCTFRQRWKMMPFPLSTSCYPSFEFRWKAWNNIYSYWTWSGSYQIGLRIAWLVVAFFKDAMPMEEDHRRRSDQTRRRIDNVTPISSQYVHWVLAVAIHVVLMWFAG